LFAGYQSIRFPGLRIAFDFLSDLYAASLAQDREAKNAAQYFAFPANWRLCKNEIRASLCFLAILFIVQFSCQFQGVSRGNASQPPKVTNAELYAFEWSRLLPKSRPTTPIIAPEKFNDTVKQWLQGIAANIGQSPNIAAASGL
jgi:hypothetical protein